MNLIYKISNQTYHLKKNRTLNHFMKSLSRMTEALIIITILNSKIPENNIISEEKYGE